MPRPAPARLLLRRSTICYELTADREELIADLTNEGFLLATGKLANGTLEGELCHAGPHELQAHLALLIANDKQLLGDHAPNRPRPR